MSNNMALRSLAFSMVFVGVLELFGQVRAEAGSLVWDWTYTTTISSTAAYVGSGTLTTGTTHNSDGYYAIATISGDWSVTSSGTTQNLTINNLVAPGDGVFGLNDDVIAPSFPQLGEGGGLSFLDSAGKMDSIFLFSTGNFGAATGDRTSISVQDDVGIFTDAIVPEPSQYGFCMVLAAAGFIAWRRVFPCGDVGLS